MASQESTAQIGIDVNLTKIFLRKSLESLSLVEVEADRYFICRLLLRKPSQPSCCGHQSCHSCIDGKYSSINDDMDSSLLDVSADMIGETPKKKPTSPRSFAKDVVKRFAIATPTSGRVNATESLRWECGSLSSAKLQEEDQLITEWQPEPSYPRVTQVIIVWMIPP
ncbi:uncharacterized protein [Dysidea avara]|uniref:uncharacterized protein isoform X2 n=1 Tax=Dysidea avara TaxID=196820 RepID=UPI00331DEE3C